MTGLATPRPSVLEGEPTYGFVMRWADLIGFPSARTFCSANRWALETVVSGKLNVQVARLARLPDDTFEQATFIRTPDAETRIGAEKIPRFDWSPEVLKICPHCITEDQAIRGRPGEHTEHIRSWWLMTHITVCPFHHVKLITEPQPGWGRFEKYPMRLLRDCFRRQQLRVEDLRIAPVKKTEAERYILGRIGFAPRIMAPCMDSVPLAHAIRLMDRMGAVAIGGRRAYTHGGKIDQNEALNCGFELFADDGIGLNDMLDQLALSAPKARRSFGANDVYGRAYQWLNEERNDPVYRPFIERFERHAIENIPLSPDVPLFGKFIGERKLFRLLHIYYESGVHWDKAGKILRALGELSPGETEPFLKRNDALRAIALLKDTMSHNVARAHIGMTRGTIKTLLDDGVVVPKIRAGEFGLTEHVFLRSDLDQMVEKARGRATKVFSKQTKTIKDIIVAARHSSTSCSEILRMLLDGSLASVGVLKGRVGLGAILVDYNDAKNALPPKSSDYLNLVELQRYLKTDYYTARNLVRFGYIKTSRYKDPVRNGTRSTFVHVTEAERFTTNYIAGQEIAAAHGTHVRALVPLLKLQGISPLTRKTNTGQYYYRRTDVGKMVIPAPKRVRNKKVALATTQ